MRSGNVTAEVVTVVLSSVRNFFLTHFTDCKIQTDIPNYSCVAVETKEHF